MKSTLASSAILLTPALAGRCVPGNTCPRIIAGCFNSQLVQPSFTADCSAFFQHTFTPPLITATIVDPAATSTLTVLQTEQQETVTLTVTPAPIIETVSWNPDLITETEYDTPTITVTSTQDVPPSVDVETITITAFPTITANTYTSTMYYNNPAKRNLVSTATDGPFTDLPAYASACGGVDSYRSACSCLGVTETTIVGPSLTATETDQLDAIINTITVEETNPQPTVTVTAIQAAVTQTLVETALPSTIQITETTDPTTVTVVVTAEQQMITSMATDTQMIATTVTPTVTRSVGPVCSSLPGDGGCGCGFVVICQRQVTLDLPTFRNHIDFNTYVSSFQECVQRCDGDPNCRFGQFAALSIGGLCSSYAGNPGFSNTGSSSTSNYFEKTASGCAANCALPQ